MATVDETMMKVQRLLTGPMGLRIQLQGDTISVVFKDSSTQTHIRFIEWGKNADGEPRTLVRISSPILQGVTPTPALYEYIARGAPTVVREHRRVGRHGEPGSVSLTLGHTLLGDFLDEEELRSAMFNVLGSADELDDVLQKRFGGKRWMDT